MPISSTYQGNMFTEVHFVDITVLHVYSIGLSESLFIQQAALEQCPGMPDEFLDLALITVVLALHFQRKSFKLQG